MTNTPSTTVRLKFLQINLQHSYAALIELYNIMDQLDPNVVLNQEQYANKQSKITSVPVNYICYDKTDLTKKFFSVAVLIKKNLKSDICAHLSSNESVIATIYFRSKKITVFCLLSSVRSLPL